MASYELNETEGLRGPVLSADEAAVDLTVELGDGASGQDDVITLEGDLGDADFGVDAVDEEFVIAPQPGPSEMEQLTVDGLHGAATRRNTEVDEADAAPEDTAASPAHVPRIDVDEETGAVRARISTELGDHGILNAHLTERGDEKELVVDDLSVIPLHVNTDLPAWLLANAADAGKAQGATSVDSIVGSPRSVDIREQVFGKYGTEFHDPSARDGDTPLHITADQARSYLGAGERTLHMRGFLPTEPDSPPLAAGYNQEELAALLNPPVEEAAAEETVVDDVTAATEPEATETTTIKVDAADNETELQEAPKPASVPDPDGRVVNEEDFAAFYAQHSGFVENILRSTRGLSPEEAADVMQESFLSAWKSREKFDGGNARAWITRISLNMATNGYRKAQRSPKVIDDEEVIDAAFRSAASTEPAPEDVAERNERIEEMTRALKEAKMPDNWRKILMLRYGYGMTEKEVAEKLGIPKGSVATGAMRGLERMRELLESRQEEQVLV